MEKLTHKFGIKVKKGICADIRSAIQLRVGICDSC